MQKPWIGGGDGGNGITVVGEVTTWTSCCFGVGGFKTADNVSKKSFGRAGLSLTIFKSEGSEIIQFNYNCN